jgi:hypothetical protein
MARQAGAAPRNAPSATRSRVPVYRSAAPSSMEAGFASRLQFKGQSGRSSLKLLEMRCGNAGAITPAHQHAVLGLAQIRNAHGEPNPDRCQRHGKSQGRNICQHAMAKIVRFIAVSLVAREVVRLLRGGVLSRLVAQVPQPAGRASQGARPEFEHAVLLFRRDGLLVFHWCQLRDILILFSTLARCLTENVDMARMRQSTPQRFHGTCRSQS